MTTPKTQPLGVETTWTRGGQTVTRTAADGREVWTCTCSEGILFGRCMHIDVIRQMEQAV